MEQTNQRWLAELIDEYRRGLNPNTRSAYGADVRAYVRAVGEAGALDATAASIARYIDGLDRKPKATRACCALRSFYSWLTERDVIRKDPIARLKFADAWGERTTLCALLRGEGLTKAAIASLRWRDLMRALADASGEARLRVGKRLRPISATTHRRLVSAFDERVCRHGVAAIADAPIIE